MTRGLNVWMNGEFVGTWTVERAVHSFAYDPTWRQSPHSRSLSLSLPISGSLVHTGDEVKNYFDNLLPDNGKIRERISKRFNTRSVEAIDLLQAIGRDCVGAVQLLPEKAIPDRWNRIECTPLSEDEIVEILQAVPTDHTPDGHQENDLFRISIAGAQEKTAFTRWQGRWCKPRGVTPTTHIFKLPLGLIGGSKRVDASDSVQNEWLCAQIVGELGLPVATTSMASFGGQPVLVVERFDREWMDSGAWMVRIPQEDFCQALGVPPDLKYEKDGGPGIAQCIKLLQGSANRSDTVLFLLTQLAFFLLAGSDGHAKNFSIFLMRSDAYEMTPLYDILSMWPYFGDGNNQFKQRKAGLAMALRSKSAHYAFHTMQARHWYDLAMKNGGAGVWNAMLGLAEYVGEALANVETRLPKDFPPRTWETISAGMKGEARRFLSEAEASGG